MRKEEIKKKSKEKMKKRKDFLKRKERKKTRKFSKIKTIFLNSEREKGNELKRMKKENKWTK